MKLWMRKSVKSILLENVDTIKVVEVPIIPLQKENIKSNKFELLMFMSYLEKEHTFVPIYTIR